MGWYAHPDTLCLAWARNSADRSGHGRYTKAWGKAYRDAYLDISRGEYGAQDYVARLEEETKRPGMRALSAVISVVHVARLAGSRIRRLFAR